MEYEMNIDAHYILEENEMIKLIIDILISVVGGLVFSSSSMRKCDGKII